MSYLVGKNYKYTSESECIIIAEKQWKYILFEMSKEVEYVCKFHITYNGNWVNFTYFKKDGTPADDYEIHCLDMFTYQIKDEILQNKKLIKRTIRKQKLEQLKQIANNKLNNGN